MGGTCHYDDGILHGAVLFKDGYCTCNSRALLTDGDIDADQVLALLIDDCINGYSCLTGLAVTDDQLTLATTDRVHTINRLNTRLYSRIHRLPGHIHSRTPSPPAAP